MSFGVVIAFLMYCNGITMYRSETIFEFETVISAILFSLSLALVLSDLDLYPRPLRKLGKTTRGVIEFFISMFLIENIMSDFWSPLETACKGLCPATAQLLQEWLDTVGLDCAAACNFLMDDLPKIIISHLLGTFFLIVALHGTRAIDLRNLECGVGFFFSEIISRIKEHVKISMLMMSIARNKSKSNKGGASKSWNMFPFAPRRCRSDIYYDDDDDDLSNTYSDFCD